jgi:hypothetical protein
MPSNYVLLRKVTLTANAASVTFSDIPQSGYTDLKIVTSLRDTNTGVANDNAISFNGITASFTGTRLYGDGNSTTSDTSARFAGSSTSASATAGTFANTEIYIRNYAGSTNKSYSVNSVTENNATGANTSYALLYTGLWSNTLAITSVTISAPSGYNFIAGSTVYLYGLAAVGTTPVIAPFASGGDVITNDGTYWYHAFLSSGTFTPTKALTCDYLVVAGGGGGGGSNTNGCGTGGGGGGGLRSTVTSTGGLGSLETALAVTAQAYAITVGAGGAGGLNTGANGTIGSNSVFSTITSTGGGGGGFIAVGGTGGSGGGGSYTGGAGPRTASPVQGFAGGAGSTYNGANYYPGGGGGGAGAAGQAGSTTTTQAGNGGVGVAISAFATPTGTGASNYYAGGGGGSLIGNFGTQTTGGAGGGGAGGKSVSSAGADGTTGTANTGGGGGAGGPAGGGSGPATGGAGGSGIVIIRYPMV